MSGVPGDGGWLARRNDEAAHLLARELVKAHESRNAIIEECARVAEGYNWQWLDFTAGGRIAAAIRALKRDTGS